METPTQVITPEAGVEKMRELMKDIKFCMFTTVASTGELRSRPMTLQQIEFDGTLWFFTGLHNAISTEVTREPRVNVTFSDPGDKHFVSASGSAKLVNNSTKKQALWHPLYEAWFPKGVDDPDLTLLAVTVENAEYWDSPHGMVMTLIGMIRAIAGGERAAVGEHHVVQL